jgi:hypothetical protein
VSDTLAQAVKTWPDVECAHHLAILSSCTCDLSSLQVRSHVRIVKNSYRRVNSLNINNDRSASHCCHFDVAVSCHAPIDAAMRMGPNQPLHSAARYDNGVPILTSIPFVSLVRSTRMCPPC